MSVTSYAKEKSMSTNEIIQQAASSPKVALAVPAVTAGIGFIEVQNMLTIASMIVGIVVAVVLLGNHLIKRRILLEQEKILKETGHLDSPVDT
jgi:hypothetical protein